MWSPYVLHPLQSSGMRALASEELAEEVDTTLGQPPTCKAARCNRKHIMDGKHVTTIVLSDCDDDHETLVRKHRGAQLRQKQPSRATIVLSDSDDDHETLVRKHRGAQSRQRQPSRAQCGRILHDHHTILVISSDSSEEEDMKEDPDLISQEFGDLTIDEEAPIASSSRNLVTVAVQTEISIPPMIVLEPSTMDMVLRDGSIGLRRNTYPCYALQQPINEGRSLTLASTTATKKTIFGQFYEVPPSTSAPPKMISGYLYEILASMRASLFSPLQEAAMSRSLKLVELQKNEVFSPLSSDRCLSMQESKKLLTFGQPYEIETHVDVSLPNISHSIQIDPHSPPAFNTRSRTKKIKKMHGDGTSI